MFDTVILLTGKTEKAALSEMLRTYNPGLSVRWVSTPADVAALDASLLRRARLVGFVTSTIVPALVLKQLGYGAYNFHPGPPHYPGWAPAFFAIHDDARQFGATAHRMDVRVDEGPIVAAELFGVPKKATIGDLEALSYVASLRLFRQLCFDLTMRADPLRVMPVGWSGAKCSRRAFAAICGLAADLPADEIATQMRQRGDHTAADFPRLQPAFPGADLFVETLHGTIADLERALTT